MGFICPSALKPGDLVSLTFQLGSMQVMGLAGKILRISLQEGKSQTLFRHHVEFTTIEPSRREQIVRFVFERQRQMNQWR
jgi:c-di-GMP-binding flagellar brake protein YcgR